MEMIVMSAIWLEMHNKSDDLMDGRIGLEGVKWWGNEVIVTELKLRPRNTLWKIIEACYIFESFYNEILKIIAISTLLIVLKQTLIILGWRFSLRLFLPMSLVKPGTCPSKSTGLSHLDIFFFPRTDLADQLSPISLKFQDVILGFRIGLFILSS